MKKMLKSLFFAMRMKKRLGIFLLLMLSFASLFAAPCGDVDSNNSIDIVDALLIAQTYVGINPGSFDRQAADVDGDGAVTIVDALLVAQYYVGLINVLPGCTTTIAPTPYLTPTPGQAYTYELQAESASWNNAEVDTKHSGYTGSGFVDTENAAGTWIEWTVTLSSPGSAVCSFRYACESDTRSMDLSVNGNVVTRLNFSPSGAWTTWITDSATVSLSSGTNRIRLTATTSGGAPNMDKLDISTNSTITTPQPTATPATPPPANGIIKLSDRVYGWASMNGGTTGGGTNIGIARTVNSMSALTSAVSGSSSKIILVEPGNYRGTLSPGANTTIIGTAPGVTITGNIKISGSDRTNIIVRNIAVRGDRCGSYDDCKNGPDAVYIGNGAHHIWFDHVDIADGQDGNFDVTKSGDFVTASWTKFHYTYDKEHKFSNLIAGSDSETQSRGKLNITYMNCWWGDRIEQRQPRGRFGKIHIFNCLYSSQNSSGSAYILGPGMEMAMIAENNAFNVRSSMTVVHEFDGYTGWLLRGNIGTTSNMNSQRGSVFTVPYNYTLMSASQVQAAVSASSGGAGNTCIFQR